MRMRVLRAALALPLLLGSTAQAQEALAPEGASAIVARTAVKTRRFMIATANPLASAAGLAMLKRGGNAIDAAIAAQMVLTLVEPQSSGIGGGAFLMYWNAKHHTVDAWDGRETAPLAADETLFLDAAGQPVKFFEAVIGGRSVGTPGVLRLLEATHKKYGKLPWASLFQPAIRLAEGGFLVSERLHILLADEPFLRRDAEARRYFYNSQGEPWPIGHRLRNPMLVRTLRQIARHGAGVFYRPPMAAAIVDKVRTHPTNPGKLALADLQAYRAQQREPVCAPYRVWLICGMPPPSSGGITTLQILGMLAHTPIATLPPHDGVPDASAVHLFSEAARLAYADRDLYIADPDFVPLADGLLDANYLAARAALIGQRSMGRARPGTPRGATLTLAADQSADRPGTSHLSIVDRDGNALAMTTTIEGAFGARQMVGGFLLNNQLSDFSFVAHEQGVPVANRLEPGKRPRSSMAPTLVFEALPDGRPGRLVMSLGSPGGPSIINYVGKTLVASLDWKLDIQAAIDLLNFGSRNGPTELERGRLPAAAEAALVEALQQRGHEVRLSNQTSGIQGVARTATGWIGGADPRREGRVLGR